MALTGWSTANYLRRAAAITTAYPYLISAWGYYDAVPAADRTYVALGQAGSNNQVKGRLMGNSASNRVRANARTTSDGNALATVDTPIGQWHHAASAFVSTTLRAAYRNGAGKGTNATSLNPSAPNDTRIGVTNNALAPFEATGGLAEVSFWSLAGMAAADYDALVAKLAAGEYPLTIDAESGEPWEAMLLAYWRLQDASDLADHSGNGHTMSMVGTLTQFAPGGTPSHPTIQVPVAAPGPTPGFAIDNLMGLL